ncbi:hypothetical protein Y032_0393g614 [Ancylostoma ceylanicum]|uniref:Uncharacterized protein n=1 Tax=Ancylostoma ceylanicum TaxID=53326 RepID=A0A016RSN1_9BILA|nr:hypothetical protein Y032_0393g614 [Ancylostoma ceylanicum]
MIACRRCGHIIRIDRSPGINITLTSITRVCYFSALLVLLFARLPVYCFCHCDGIFAEQPTVSSGVAAGVTIGIFFLVFLFTFGCRIYSQYADRSQAQNTRSQG